MLGEIRSTYKIFVGKSLGKNPLGTPNKGMEG
jgi:hypothetical protein